MENELKKRGKTEGYSSVKLTAKRNRKRIDAEARQLAYEDLTLTQRLERAKARDGESKCEVARLETLIKEAKGKKNVNN